MSSCVSSERDSVQCRICLGSDIKNLTNPIISPCKCSGSMKLVHLECLRCWIKQRVDIQERPHVTIMSWKSLNCELCKTPYPFAVYFNGHIYELVTYKHPNPPYVIFEHFLKEGGDSNGLFIISFSKKPSLKIVSDNFHL